MNLDLRQSQKPGCSSRSDADLSSLLNDQLLAAVASGAGDTDLQLLETVGDLLCKQEPGDTVGVAQHFPQVGKALTLVAQRRPDRDGHSIFLDNVRWFQAKSEASAAQVALSSQSQRLIRNSVVFPQECIDESLLAFVGILGTVPLPTLILTLQHRLTEYLASNRANVEQLESLCALATKICDSRVGNCAVSAAGGLLETLVRQCPVVDDAGCPEFVGAFYETIEKEVDRKRGEFAPSLLEQLSRRYPVFLERQVVKLFDGWVRDGASSLADNWLVCFGSGSRRLFQDLYVVLHTLLVKLDYASEARTFVKEIVVQIKLKTPAHQIYPDTFAAILMLLEVELTGLPAPLVEGHAITVMNTMLAGLMCRTFDVFEVVILVCHYSDWWSHVQCLSKHGSKKIRMKYKLLENIVFGTSLMSTLRKPLSS